LQAGDFRRLVRLRVRPQAHCLRQELAMRSRFRSSESKSIVNAGVESSS
jgi:hypothetical protein